MMKENDDDPVVQRVRQARELLAKDAGYDLKTYLKILRKHQVKRLAGKSKFRRPGKSGRVKKN
jgi:hypothetical protein